MQMWLKAMNPTATITTEAEALRAGRASAIAIFIGVVVGAIGAAWTLMNPQAIEAAVAAQGTDAATAAAAQAGAQAGLWLGMALIVVQLIFGVVQWREPKKFIAILFIVLIILGMVMTLATPMMAGMAPGTPVPPMWQLALSIAIMAVQLVLHFAGVRGIGRLDAMQMEAAR